jgi:type I restriction-modification system DNA methylase subunit
MDKEKARQEIQLLVDKYNRFVAEGRDSKYKEEETKKDFILPLFRALGWDVENRSRPNEVTAEETISKKRVDYGFRINGIPKFFLEAKSLREDVDKRGFIDQAINYSWLKGCTWAVLTNFETVEVFNAELKADHPWQSMLKLIHCRDFLAHLDELWLLSRESFELGLIDKEAEKWGKKTRKISVDEQLLTDFTRFRELLSRNITKLNQQKHLSEEELDEAVQRILDRLIFIRNCEDRELEPRALISNYREWESRGRGQLIKSLRETFAHFDDEYNSKIFVKHLCDDLDVDNEVLHEIVEGLYSTKDKSISYDFSVIDADVLGAVYEQYLSHILKKTRKRASLTENYAHRKEQGIYYTPIYIVDYIVRNTLGELLKEKNVDVDRIRICDPACGSGSFLIKAFDVLNEYYRKNDVDYSQTQLDLETGTSFTRKAKILQDNIFGVDLDKQAVEIAQLNLLLKLAERGHRLPLLEQNIKCGNSIIDDEKVSGDKAFKWKEEFEEIIEQGGFDVVMGNPPYVRNTELSDSDKKFFSEKYSSAYGQYDIFVLFFEIGIRLLKNGGYLGFIASNKFIASDYGLKLRDLILESCKIKKLVDASYLRVFKDASTYPIIMILQKENNDSVRKDNLVAFQKIRDAGAINADIQTTEVKQSKFTESKDNRFLEDMGSVKFELAKKIEHLSMRVSDIFACQRGSPGNKIRVVNIKMENSLPCITSRNVDRYSFIVPDNIFIESDLQSKIFSKEKILLPRTVLSLKAAYDEGNHFVMDRIYYLTLKSGNTVNLKFVTGLLNSSLIDFYYKVNFGTTHVGGGYLDLRGAQIEQLPIRIPSETEQERIIDRVEKILSLSRRLDQIGDKLTDERMRIKEEIRTTDLEINKAVYRIYEITEDEKAIIEDSLK